VTQSQARQPNFNTNYVTHVAGKAASQVQERERGRTHRTSSSSARRSRHIARPTGITICARPLCLRLCASCACSSSSSSARSTPSFAALSEKQRLELALTLVLVD
jgi:hypothetical protein